MGTKEAISGTTVTLITTAVHQVASDTKPGRTEAVYNASRLALVDNGDAWEGRPAFCALLIVVGEGGR